MNVVTGHELGYGVRNWLSRITGNPTQRSTLARVLIARLFLPSFSPSLAALAVGVGVGACQSSECGNRGLYIDWLATMERDPCPKRIWNDSGAGFAMGAIGGSMFHGIKGFRNSPSPAVRHVSQCSSSSSSSSSSSGRARWLVKCVSHWNEWISMAVDQVSRRLCCVEGARTSDRRQLRYLGRTLLGHRLLAGADTQEGGACGRVWVGAHRISAACVAHWPSDAGPLECHHLRSRHRRHPCRTRRTQGVGYLGRHRWMSARLYRGHLVRAYSRCVPLTLTFMFTCWCDPT